jgi:hypothetical protein
MQWALAATCAVALCGCGGSGASSLTAHPRDAATPVGARAPGGAAVPTAAAAGVVDDANRAAPTAPASARPGTGAAAASSSPLRIALGATCVTPGGRQTVAITLDGAASVSFNTRYADGNLGTTYGGSGVGTTAADGTYRSAFTVSAAAPLGTATVNAGASRNGHLWTAAPATFTVATRC